MTREQVSLTRAEALRRRRAEEQASRENRRSPRRATPQPASAPRAVSRPSAREASPLRLVPASSGRIRRRYEAAFNRPTARPHPGLVLPEFHLPRLTFGPRWISFLILALCLGVIYSLTNMDPFIVRGVTIAGNTRVSSQEIEAVLGVLNQPSALLNPAQVEYNILASFPEISAAQIQINLPAEIFINVQERVPVIAWQQDGQTVWVDASGYAFSPRGQVSGLLTVTANGAPPLPDSFSLQQTLGARAFLPADLAQAIASITPAVPAQASLLYDPIYGFGWYDSRGWQIYFGHSAENIELKLSIYQGMVDYFTRNDIQPSLVSVEYPAAPYYRLKE